MKLDRDDLTGFAWPLAIFLCALAFAVSVPIVGQRFLQKMLVEESKAEKALAAANDRVREAQRDRENLSSYQAAYGALLQRGIVGEFKRLDLIEQLEKIGSGFFEMQYSISPQRTLPASGSFALNVNSAVFRLGLLHEGRLLDFFDVLGAQTKGIPLVEGCALERIDAAVGNAAHLQSVCTVSWVTFGAVK